MPNNLQALEAQLVTALSQRQHIDALNALARELRDTDAQHGLELATTAYTLAQAEDYQNGRVDSLVNQSHCNNWLSNFVVALAQGLEALSLLEQLGDYPDRANVLFALSRAQLNLANFSESVDLGRRAQTLAVAAGDRSTEADVLNVLGINYYRSGNYPLAFAVYTDALHLHRTLGNKRGECRVLINIAQAHSTLRQYDEALAVGLECLQIVRVIDSRMLEGYTLHTLGQIYADRGTFEAALDHLQQSLPIAHAIGNHYLYLVSLVALGQVYVRLAQFDCAVLHFYQALTIADEIGSKIYIFRCHEALADIYERQGDFAQALAHYKQFHAVKEAVFNEESSNRLQSLEIIHQTETARKEAEIYHLRNVQLEQEIAERKRLEVELNQQISTDVLTGAANRRHFLVLAHAELIRTERFNHPLALALIDLDYFKQINDTYGHAVGDQTLITLARTFQHNIREHDIFARFGGDEFVLLLPETNSTQAYVILERIRRVLTRQPFDLNGSAVSISISSGIASLLHEHESLDTLLARADQALYQAKAAGRNRVAVGGV